jgi:hypothetical protein
MWQSEITNAESADVSPAAAKNLLINDALSELASKKHAGRGILLANSSNDGFPCHIYRTKSDCDWHPPCHWSGACD